MRGGGFDCWFDDIDLLPGENRQSKLRRMIQGARFIVLCLSKRAVTEPGDFQRQLSVAFKSAEKQPHGKIFLVPVLLEPCDVPDQIEPLLCVRWFEPKDRNRLLDALERLTSKVNAS